MIKKIITDFTKFSKLFFVERTRMAILLVFVILGIFGSYYYAKYKETKLDPNIEAQKETQLLVGMVSKIMELPEGEFPTVANIVDKTKLNGQVFFTKAENGDVLLAYTKNMIAILYRPSINKIINVAPITIDQQKNLTQGNTENPRSVSGHKHTVTYYNGTEIVGIASTMEKLVRTTYKDYETKSVTNASRKDYTETLIINISGDHEEEANELAKLLHGKVTTLPKGEVAPDSDILIISGQ